MLIPKTFDPAAIEARWYAHWEAAGRFRPARPEAEPFTIVIPPPNVTGSLHIGHALDNTLQDILIRHARLQGKDALWVVGTDHAGIATQMVVERRMAERGEKRADFSREEFVRKVWEWKEESGGTITRQLRRLGASCDWANERFTMDEGFSKAVAKVFVDLHREGLLYRDKRLVNWDPYFRTAISDLEVEQREVKGHFWHFRYPLEDGSGHIAIATTRPETILGDGAVAVNPEDARYTHLVGKRCLLPIVNRSIPIIADAHVKMDFGSGAVKITAAHDYNDYDVYRRHPEANIPLINLMNADATMNENTPEGYRGLDRYAARAKVVADFAALGLLDKVEEHVHMVPHGDRSGVPIEPWLTDQWYVDAKTLAGPAIEAVRSGAIRVVPETWKKTWYNWLENIQPWCVSRQLWWGHRIPAWYGPGQRDDGSLIEGDVIAVSADWRVISREPIRQRVFVANNEAEVLEQAAQFYPAGTSLRFSDDWSDIGESEANTAVLRRDPDVLDTWFSSALWPFATLGWPDTADPPRNGEGDHAEHGGGGYPLGDPPAALPLHPSPAASGPPPRAGEDPLSRHYPNDVLVSGFDILFFWDARMAMQGLHVMGEIPWKTLYLHGLVRDATGAKMSKSKGNTVDPLGLIDRYGADALRFTLAAMESQGRDIKLDEKRVEGYRNFATKLWNATRFAQANGIGASTTLEAPPAELPVNRWIIAETIRTVQALDLALADFRFDEAANTLYQFVWATFCDWYLELIKGAVDAETKAVAGWTLDQILVMLHPFMPFVTEELWHALGERDHDLILARWPKVDARAIDGEAAAEVEWLIALVQQVRTARTELNVPPGTRLIGYSEGADARMNRRLADGDDALTRLARVSWQPVEGDRSGPCIRIPLEGGTLVMPLEGVIDLAAERARLDKSAAAAEKERDALAARLANPGFVERAKPEAVAKARADHAERGAEAERLRAALARLGPAMVDPTSSSPRA